MSRRRWWKPSACRRAKKGVVEGRTVAAPALLIAPIHRSAWNRNSANFAFREFCELRLLGILGSSYPPSCIASPPCPKPSLALTSAVLAHNIRRYGHPLAGGLGQSGRPVGRFHAGMNFAFTEFYEVTSHLCT